VFFENLDGQGLPQNWNCVFFAFIGFDAQQLKKQNPQKRNAILGSL
jgi:hypothetical protein